MHLTFAQAYEIVCPDGRTVAPYSKDFSDIQELMRQSGHVPFQDKIASEIVPRPPTDALQARHFIEQVSREPPPLKISKRQWLSVEANKQSFLAALNKNK